MKVNTLTIRIRAKIANLRLIICINILPISIYMLNFPSRDKNSKKVDFIVVENIKTINDLQVRLFSTQ